MIYREVIKTRIPYNFIVWNLEYNVLQHFQAFHNRWRIVRKGTLLEIHTVYRPLYFMFFFHFHLPYISTYVIVSFKLKVVVIGCCYKDKFYLLIKLQRNELFPIFCVFFPHLLVTLVPDGQQVETSEVNKNKQINSQALKNARRDCGLPFSR